MSEQFYKAIAFSGGGGKGAYQIGIIKALDKYGFIKQVKYLSGTSVGALNAALAATGDSELAEYIWLNFVHKSNMLMNIEKGKLSVSRDAIKSIIKYVGVHRINNGVPVYVYLYDVKKKESLPFLLNGNNETRITELLLASSALPVVYAPVIIDGREYIDGGVTALGNNPVEILYEIGCKKILLASISSNFNQYDVRAGYDKYLNINTGSSVNLVKRFPNAKIDIIKPILDNGNFFNGTIDFSPDGIRSRISCGYYDTIQFLDKKGHINMTANENIRLLASELLSCGADFEEFVSLSKFTLPNAKTSTLGGKVFYENIYECDGWRIQQHSGLLKIHYRILDPHNVRRAWTLDSAELEKNLIIYKDTKARKQQ